MPAHHYACAVDGSKAWGVRDCSAASHVVVLREAEAASGVIGNALLPSPLYIWLYKHYFILQSRDNRNSIVSSARENVPSGFGFVQKKKKNS